MEKQKAISVGGIPVDLFEERDYEQLLVESVRNNQKKTFFNSNAHMVVLANTKFPWLKKLFREKVDYVMCDGAGIQMGAWLRGKPVPQKIAYNAWFWNYASFCAKNGYRIFFLGAREEVIVKAAENMKKHAPELIISHHHGYFNKGKEHPENLRVIETINSFKPHVLLVGFGMPDQEKWIMDHMGDISCNAFFPCGGAFDFFAGKRSLAPKLFRNLKMEWFYRMLLEPVRLGKRYLVENPKFLYYVLKNP